MNEQQVTFNVLDAIKSPDEVEDYNFISVLDFAMTERLNSCCSKEKINVITFVYNLPLNYLPFSNLSPAIN